MDDLLVATTNEGKLAEVRVFLKDIPFKVISLRDLDNPPTVVEDGESFEENALMKARVLAEFSGLVTLADDSGLEVDALGGAPGIYSARYGGVAADDVQNNAKLLRALESVPAVDRTARFVCALALCAPRSADGKEWVGRESCEGRIAFALAGGYGFGYDPLFYYPPFDKTFGQIDAATKATVSHRGKALKQLVEVLPTFLGLTVKP